jgi:hypothetical protein
MGHYFVTYLPRDYRKLSAYVLILLTPGSFIVLPALGLIKFLAVRRQSERNRPCVQHASPPPR